VLPRHPAEPTLSSHLRDSAALAAEVSWPGCIALILAVLLTCWAGCSALLREHARLQEARWHDVLINLQRQIEAELALGFDLEDSQRAEHLLEGAWRQGDDSQQLTVFDAAGQTLFDTDRSAVGEQVRDAWRGVAGQVSWRVASQETIAIGAPLHGPSGAVIGHVALTIATAQQPHPWAAMVGASIGVAGLATLIMALPLAGLGRALRAAPSAASRLDDAEARVARADDALRAAPPAP